MAFALSRLTAFAQKRDRKTDPLSEMPVLRRADAHPDAPPRRPIFANSDFGGAGMFADPPTMSEANAEETADDLLGGSEPAIVQPTDQAAEDRFDPVPPAPAENDGYPGFAPLAAPVPPPGMETPETALPAPRAPKPLDALTIAELAERFEHGLARRNGIALSHPQPISTGDMIAAQPAPRVLAEIPPADPVAVKSHVDDEADRALREALGALQRISAR